MANADNNSLAPDLLQRIRSLLPEIHRRRKGLVEDFARLWDDTTFWPYLIDEQSTVAAASAKGSSSTISMILYSLGVALGGVRDNVLAPALLTPDIDAEDNDGTAGSAQNVFNKASQKCFEAFQSEIKAGQLTSGTWGTNDPFTLTWLLALSLGTGPQRELVQLANKRTIDSLADPRRPVLETGGSATPLAHTWPVLRSIQLAMMIRNIPGTTIIPTEEAKDWLHEQLHLNLSNAEIREAACDPAELVFSYEALHLLRAGDVTPGLTERVFNVLSAETGSSAYWRPLRPMTVSQRGLVLLISECGGCQFACKSLYFIGSPRFNGSMEAMRGDAHARLRMASLASRHGCS